MQGSYIGNTTASQAVKAGSIPVPCSKEGHTPVGCVFLFFVRICPGNCPYFLPKNRKMVVEFPVEM